MKHIPLPGSTLQSREVRRAAREKHSGQEPRSAGKQAALEILADLIARNVLAEIEAGEAVERRKAPTRHPTKGAA